MYLLRNIKTYIGILFIAFSISPLSVHFMQGLGLNVIEPWLFIGGIILFSGDKYYKFIFRHMLINANLRNLMLLYTSLFVLGFVMTGELKYAYADYRVVILFTFSYMLFSNGPLLNYKNGLLVKSLLWSIILFDIIYSYIYIKEYQLGLIESVKIRLVSPVVIVDLMALYLLRWRNSFKAFVLFLIIFYFVIFGAMRNFFVIGIVSAIIMIIGLVGKSIKWYNKLLLLFAIIIIPILFADKIMDFWLSDPNRAIHTIQRTEQTLNGEDSEISRVNSFLYPIINFPYYLFPHGIGWRGFWGHYDNSDVYWFASADSSFYYIAFHYSIIALIAFLRFIIIKWTNVLFKCYITMRQSMIILLLGILFFVAFFTQGTMFMQVEFGFGYGALLALFINSGWLRNKVNEK